MKDKRNEGKTQRQRKGGQKTVDQDQRFDSRQRNKDGMMERKMGKDIKSKRKCREGFLKRKKIIIEYTNVKKIQYYKH